MSDFAERRARVEAIVKAVRGRVIGHSRNVMHIEVPADVAAGMSTFWGMGGYRVIFSGQTTRLENRRIVNTQGHTVVCENDPVLTAFVLATSLAVESSIGSVISTPPVRGRRPRTGRPANHAVNDACDCAGSSRQLPAASRGWPAGLG